MDKPTRDFFEMALKLVIGNKNYSSWSMRPWLALRANNIPFDEVFIPLYTGEADKKRILSFTHSGKVPALINGDVTVWDSLAIIEYVAERFPQTRLVARGSGSPGACAFDFGGDAFGLCSAAQRMRHEPAPAGARNRAVGRGARRYRAHSAGLDRVPRAPRKIWAVPVRRLRRRGRHVCAGGASLSNLCDRSSAGGSGLHGHDDVVTGLSGVDALGACRDPRDREVRDGVGQNCQGFGATASRRRGSRRSGRQAGAYGLGLRRK